MVDTKKKREKDERDGAKERERESFDNSARGVYRGWVVYCPRPSTK